MYKYYTAYAKIMYTYDRKRNRNGGKISSVELQMEPIIFLEKKLKGDEPARCVDGREATKSPQGPQMLGGSLQPLITEAVYKYQDFDEQFVSSGLQRLKEQGFTTGVHHGSHAKRQEDKSDCGLADRLRDIIATAIKRRKEITKRLGAIYDQEELTKSGIEIAYAHLAVYDPNRITIIGENLVNKAIETGANDETVEDDHAEEIAFFNLKEGTTLNTQELNTQGNQAFNLDAWMAVKQAKALGVEQDTATALAGILYIATGMVLVEDKGKAPLPIVIHK